MTERVRPGPRRGMSEDVILDAALALLDAGGAQAASIRGIAGRLGVAPNAVYTYFPDKAAIEKGIVERLFGEVNQAVLTDRRRGWRKRVEAVALELRTRLVAHPGAVGLMLGGPMDGPNAVALNEKLLRLLVDAGLEAAEAARATYLLIVYVFGTIALEVADPQEPGPLPPESERIAQRRVGFDEIPADVFPLSAAAAPVMAEYISTDQYLWGLRRILDGLAT